MDCTEERIGTEGEANLVGIIKINITINIRATSFEYSHCSRHGVPMASAIYSVAGHCLGFVWVIVIGGVLCNHDVVFPFLQALHIVLIMMVYKIK